MQSESYPLLADTTVGRIARSIDGRTQVVEARRRAERTAALKPPYLATSPEKASALRAILDAAPSVGGDTQNRRVLRALRELGEVTVMELRTHCDVQHAPARVRQLKNDGHSITGRWVRQLSALGHEHRTMAYTLTHEAEA